jgi:hypothetical protein
VLYLECGSNPSLPKLIGAGTVILEIFPDQHKHVVMLFDAFGSPVATAKLQIALRNHGHNIMSHLSPSKPLHTPSGISANFVKGKVSQDKGKVSQDTPKYRPEPPAPEPPQPTVNPTTTCTPPAVCAAPTHEHITPASVAHDVHYHYHLSGCSAEQCSPPHGLLSNPCSWTLPTPGTNPRPHSGGNSHAIPLGRPRSAVASANHMMMPDASLSQPASYGQQQHEGQSVDAVLRSAREPNPAMKRLVQEQPGGSGLQHTLPAQFASINEGLMEAAKVHASLAALQASARKGNGRVVRKPTKGVALRKKGRCSANTHRSLKDVGVTQYGMNAFMAFAWEMIGYVSIRSAMSNALVSTVPAGRLDNVAPMATASATGFVKCHPTSSTTVPSTDRRSSVVGERAAAHAVTDATTARMSPKATRTVEQKLGRKVVKKGPQSSSMLHQVAKWNAPETSAATTNRAEGCNKWISNDEEVLTVVPHGHGRQLSLGQVSGDVSVSSRHASVISEESPPSLPMGCGELLAKDSESITNVAAVQPNLETRSPGGGVRGLQQSCQGSDTVGKMPEDVMREPRGRRAAPNTAYAEPYAHEGVVRAVSSSCMQEHGGCAMQGSDATLMGGDSRDKSKGWRSQEGGRYGCQQLAL